MPSLEVLNLASNHFTGPLPPLTNNTLLKELDVGGNLLTGKILTYSSIGSNLNSLLLGNNQLTGMIPDFELPVLHHLDVGRNWLTVRHIPHLPCHSFTLYTNVSIIIIIFHLTFCFKMIDKYI